MVAVEVTLPSTLLSAATAVDVPEQWNADNVDWSVGRTPTQAISDAWLAAGASLLLRVPSVVVPVGWNYVLNPAHPDARKLRTRRIDYRPDPRLS